MTRVARPGPLALTMPSRGEITTASATLGSEMATLVTSCRNVINSPRPSSSVISRVCGRVVEGAVGCAGHPAASRAAHHSLAILIETIPGRACLRGRHRPRPWASPVRPPAARFFLRGGLGLVNRLFLAGQLLPDLGIFQ